MLTRACLAASIAAMTDGGVFKRVVSRCLAFAAARPRVVMALALLLALTSGRAWPAVDDGLDPSEPKEGWTQFDRAQAERIVYVSHSEGDDANPGLSPAAPVKTVARGKALLRDGRGDWLLLKRGDEFPSGLGTWDKSGASAEAPMVIGAYGQGRRPRLHPQGQHFLFAHGQGASHLAFVSLYAHATQRDPEHPDFNGGTDKAKGVLWLGAGENIRFENCVIDSFNLGLELGNPEQTLKNVTLYRCIVRDAYATTDQGNSQGIFTRLVRDLVIRECIFFHNGWSEQVEGSERTVFNHNLYLSSTKNLLIEDSMIVDGALNGMNLRTTDKTGGEQQNVTVRGNLLVGNANAISATGKRGSTLLSTNLLIEKNVAHKHGAAVTFQGDPQMVANGIALSNWDGAILRDNLLLEARDEFTGRAINIERAGHPDPVNHTITRNVVHDWLDNEIPEPTPNVTVTDNRVGLAPSAYVDPTRTLERYITDVAEVPSREAFFRIALRMRKGSWNPTFTAPAVVPWMRAGFELKPAP